jgi:hypothetical protein
MSDKSQSRVHVHQSRSRCPFCHESVDVDQQNLVCGLCLARHHSECWDDHGSCSNCAHQESLISKAVIEEVRTGPVLASRYLAHSRIDSFKMGQTLVYKWRDSGMSQGEKICFAGAIASLCLIAPAVFSESFVAVAMVIVAAIIIGGGVGHFWVKRPNATLILSEEGLALSQPTARISGPRDHSIS